MGRRWVCSKFACDVNDFLKVVSENCTDYNSISLEDLNNKLFVHFELN